MARRIIPALVAAGVALAVGVAICPGFSARTPPLTDADGKAIPGSIAALERVELGGLDQWILIREYCEVIEAPEKALVVFENSAHLPFLAETEKFTERVIAVGSR